MHRHGLHLSRTQEVMQRQPEALKVSNRKMSTVKIHRVERLWCDNCDRSVQVWVYSLTTYRFRPEVVDGGRLGMVEARSWTERVLGWVGSSMRPGASAGCWASGCRGNARRNGRTSRFWLRPC